MLMISIKTIMILLMLGLLFLGEAPVVAEAPLPNHTSSDWIRLIGHLGPSVISMIFLRLLLGALATSTTPLLTWLVVKSAAKPYRGVKR